VIGPYLPGPNDAENGIYVGDALALMRGLPDESIDLIVTDPPYNAGIDYGEQVDDSLPTAEYLDWYARICAECYRVIDNGYLYASCTTHQLWTTRPLWEAVGFSFQVMLIWHGPNYASNSNVVKGQWRLLYEPIMMFLKGKRPAMIDPGKGTDISSDAVLRFTRPQTGYGGELKRVHPCQKPLGLYRTIIARTPGEIVLDPFVGSGTTAMAAKSLDRKYLGFEINPEYAEDARKRIVGTQAPLFTLEADQPLLIPIGA